MAEITLISRNLTPQVLQMAIGLHQQKKSVMILTSFGQKVEHNYDFQILTYFKKWSALEAMKILPKLFFPNANNSRPDVFHFIFEQEEESASAAHWFILAATSSFRKSSVATLLGPKIKSKNWKWNPFLKYCTAVTVPSRERLMYLKRRKLISESSLNEVILPMSEPDLIEEVANPDLDRFLESIKPFVLIPAHPNSDFLTLLSETLSASKLKVLFIGERTPSLNKFSQFFAIAPANVKSLEKIVANSQAVLLAFHEYEAPELIKWQILTMNTQKTLIVRTQQTEILPGICLHKKNGFVIERSWPALQKLLQEYPLLSLTHYLKGSDLVPSIDHSLNEFNRLYVRSLTHH